ncbi:MAG: ABC transporter ATP-binding protein [Candidatus Methylomirabilales bacterium]
MPAVAAQHLSKVFGRGETEVVALKDVNLSVEPGELVALMGPSGSGKTTLLRALSLIDPPTSGCITIAGEQVCADALATVDDRRLRREKVGMIFQAYNLIPFLTAAENVALVLTLEGVPRREALRRARELLQSLDLLHRADTYPATLSGGEQQRLAVARAVINNPAVILADEPTAALDTERGKAVMQLLRRLGREHQAAVIVVTHDERMLDGFDRIYHMVDGRIGTS